VPEAVLFVDTFTRWLEPENARAAARVLAAGRWSAMSIAPSRGARPLCCGRTYLSAGMLDEARAEARRTVEVLAPHAERGAAIVGLEPSCLYTLKDEVPDLVPTPAARAVASQAVLLEELLDREWGDTHALTFAAGVVGAVHVHGHCHQKAFGGHVSTLRMLARLPDANVTAIESSCCGMAGSFGYHAEHYDVSMKMGELSIFPAVRAASKDATIVADGTSCRAQIADGTGRRAVHAAVVLARALDANR
ncbi:MAG: heterodisulfide reductase-related iron-sulfur binding cluster, partial [Longimicrobiales bacterium]